jgi:hypothetical protein
VQRAPPHPSTEEAQEGVQRPWWRRLLGWAEAWRAGSGKRFDREMLWRRISEMEVLSSRAVYACAVEAFEFAVRHHAVLRGEEEPPVARDSYGEEIPFDREDFREMMDVRLYRFIRTVRKELGVSTDFRPLVIIHKGKPLGTPEDIWEIEEIEQPKHHGPGCSGLTGGCAISRPARRTQPGPPRSAGRPAARTLRRWSSTY